jgi:DNA/RNA endonuclease YhcR with UshA esterase domain
VNERQMALASLLLAFFGILVILLAAKGMKPVEAKISGLGELEGKYVEVGGFVSSVRITGGNAFITLCDGECTTIVVFKSIAEKMQSPNPYLLKKGDRLTVCGQVVEFRGEMEIEVIRGDDLQRG